MGGYSTKGHLHEELCIPKQDYVLLRRRKRWLLTVVADGLGSHPHSSTGSLCACIAAAKTASAYCDGIAGKEETFLINLAKNWHTLIAPYSANECGTTCLLALYLPLSNELLLAQLGDGEIVCECEGKVMVLLEKQEEFLNITHSLSKVKPSEWRFCLLHPGNDGFRLYMHTDGIDILPERRESFLAALSKMSTCCQNDRQMTESLRALTIQEYEGATDDDRTLAFMRMK